MIKVLFLQIFSLLTIFCYGNEMPQLPQENFTDTFSSKIQKEQYSEFIKNRNSNPEKAYTYALELVNDIDSTLIFNKEIADLYQFISKYDGETLFKYKNAIKYGETAYRIYNELDMKKEAARMQATVAEYNFKIGNMHLSFNNILNAMDIAYEIKDTISIRECALVMERIHYYYYKDEVVARAYNDFVSKNATNIIEEEQRSRALNNLFHYPLSLEETDSIIKVSEEIYNNRNVKKNLVSVYLNAVLKYSGYNEMDLAKLYLDKSETMLTNIKDSGYYYSAAGYYYLMKEDHDESIKALKLAIEYLGKGDFNPQMLLRSYDILQWIHTTRGDYENAYEYLKLMTDTYINVVNEEKIIELSKSLNELKERRNRELNREYKSRINILILILILLFISIALFLYIYIQRRKLVKRNTQLEEEKHRNELKAKDDLIKVKRLQQYQENIFIKHIIGQLEEISSKSNNPNQDIKGIIRELEGRKDKSDWVEVEKSLEGNNDAFMKNLVNAHPDLTINERRLCTFMHMNMSTKEISNITHQSINGINAARTRLRKKFGLTGDDKSLIAYLDKFNQP